MIDHLGNVIRVGWSDHHLVWIDAALTLPRQHRTAAYRDIADMTGRTLAQVREKAYSVNQARMEAARYRRVVVPVRALVRPAAALPPSIITPISEARKMGGRA